MERHCCKFTSGALATLFEFVQYEIKWHCKFLNFYRSPQEWPDPEGKSNKVWPCGTLFLYISERSTNSITFKAKSR